MIEQWLWILLNSCCHVFQILSVFDSQQQPLDRGAGCLATPMGKRLICFWLPFDTSENYNLCIIRLVQK